MSKRGKLRTGLFATVAAITVLFALGVAQASAALHWSDTTHGMNVSGSLTLTKKGQSKTCTLVTSSKEQVSVLGPGLSFSVKPSWASDLRFTCTGGGAEIFSLIFKGGATTKEGSNVLQFVGSGNFLLFSPWQGEDGFFQGAEKIPTGKFVNGSGLTPSKVTFSSSEIGWDSDLWPVTATGSLNVTTSTGGLLTLQP